MTISDKPKVLMVGEFEEDCADYQAFASHFDLIHYTLTTREQFIKDLQTPLLNDIQAIFPMWFGFNEIGMLHGADIIDALPKSLKIIVCISVGYDHYDSQALKERGIIFCNTPSIAADQVADMALFLTISSYRYTTLYQTRLRELGNSFNARSSTGSNSWKNGAPTALESSQFNFGERVGGRIVLSPRGKRVGIAGLGAIGKAIAKRLDTIGMSEINYMRGRSGALSEAEIKTSFLDASSGYYNELILPKLKYRESFKELCENSDLLILALPATPETKGILNKESIKYLPPGAKVVNIGRGALIDTRALVDALDSGHISSAGLDVFENEPDVEDYLVNRLDVTLTPHIGSSTMETLLDSMAHCFNNIEDVVLRGGKGTKPV
ncbi:hypothetical protein NADFUDRAFT_80943 [Nadsonia fulvescens var. elongata DSM 6958]|uniref:Uncharacterized protein n=1 Tax=Nadsonia fulvescens var. elongata DSM 6958 TaxID=857566 RepID=A0A1E3PQQ9_9ASCO|nr:hypothetical protein NADFUDRAFT_80943 [Nadsonia fulvescens var. elongata DSM 6958]